MPKTTSGKRVMKSMLKTYKTKKKAESVFNAMINEKAKGSSKWHSKTTKNKK